MADAPSDASARIAAWAGSRADIAALVQIGSRVQDGGARADRWSDYDYQLVTRTPAAYADPAALAGLGDVWLSSLQPVFGGVSKLTVILAGGAEADFVILPCGPIRVAFGALRFPALAGLWPAPLRAGLRDLRIVAAPGWRIIKGGPAWERRYARLGAAAPWPRLDAAGLAALWAAYWAGAVWMTKKIARGELRAAHREFHRTLLEQAWRLLEEEGRARGAAVRPEARRAESWATADQLARTDLTTAPDAARLHAAAETLHDLVTATAAALAAARGWPAPDAAAVRAWVRAQAAAQGVSPGPGT